LAHIGDALVWAAPVRTGQGVVIMRQVQDAWQSEVVPTFGVAAEIGDTPTGLRLLIVQGDMSLPTDGSSLLIWEPVPTWKPIRRVVHGDGEGAVYEPSYTALSDGG